MCVEKRSARKEKKEVTVMTIVVLQYHRIVCFATTAAANQATSTPLGSGGGGGGRGRQRGGAPTGDGAASRPEVFREVSARVLSFCHANCSFPESSATLSAICECCGLPRSPWQRSRPGPTAPPPVQPPPPPLHTESSVLDEKESI